MIRPFTKRDKTNLTCPKCGSNPFLFKDKGITYMLETEDQYEYLQNIIDEAVCDKVMQKLQEGINDSNRRLAEKMEYPDYLEEM